ncbi:hypothetical protein [Kibdelosporangium phytohabitans]|uniref:hypothetical protein n=1 Tax=Kibdelosporangium phytohabitans TaxID=860235 RepID=UPI0012F7F986|nr:hypothetical protein [Kibdelosporangium phytohabitans]MBE1471933.1 hypothetical protein [Kibdelosporangium phytohabitans]
MIDTLNDLTSEAALVSSASCQQSAALTAVPIAPTRAPVTPNSTRLEVSFGSRRDIAAAGS